MSNNLTGPLFYSQRLGVWHISESFNREEQERALAHSEEQAMSRKPPQLKRPPLSLRDPPTNTQLELLSQSIWLDDIPGAMGHYTFPGADKLTAYEAMQLFPSLASAIQQDLYDALVSGQLEHQLDAAESNHV